MWLRTKTFPREKVNFFSIPSILTYHIIVDLHYGCVVKWFQTKNGNKLSFNLELVLGQYCKSCNLSGWVCSSSLRRRRNLTLVSNVCEVAPRSFFWGPSGLKQITAFQISFHPDWQQGFWHCFADRLNQSLVSSVAWTKVLADCGQDFYLSCQDESEQE